MKQRSISSSLYHIHRLAVGLLFNTTKYKWDAEYILHFPLNRSFYCGHSINHDFKMADYGLKGNNMLFRLTLPSGLKGNNMLFGLALPSMSFCINNQALMTI